MFDSHGVIIEEISLFTKMFQNLEIYTMDYDDSKGEYKRILNIN